MEPTGDSVATDLALPTEIDVIGGEQSGDLVASVEILVANGNGCIV